MLLWPLLIVNLRILGLTWRGTIYFVQHNRTNVLPDDTRQTKSELHDFGTTLEAWRLKTFHNFHFLQSDMVFGMTNSFSGIYDHDAVSSEKSYSTSFLLTYIKFRTVKFFLLNPDFRRGSRIQGCHAGCHGNTVTYKLLLRVAFKKPKANWCCWNKQIWGTRHQGRFYRAADL